MVLCFVLLFLLLFLVIIIMVIVVEFVWKVGIVCVNIIFDQFMWMVGYGGCDCFVVGKLIDFWGKVFVLEDDIGY